MAEQANALDLVQAAREMIRARGAPNTAENLNRAMLALTREDNSGLDSVEFDSKLDRYAGGGRGAGSGTRGASQTEAPKKRGAVARHSDGRVAPDPGNTATGTRGNARGEIENKPLETVRAGDSERSPVTAPMNKPVPGQTYSLPLEEREPKRTTVDLEGNGTRVPVVEADRAPYKVRARGPDTVDGPEQVSGSSARPQMGGTRTAAAAETGTPDDLPLPPPSAEDMEVQRLQQVDPPIRGTVSPLDLIGGGARMAARVPGMLFGQMFRQNAPESAPLPPGSVNPPTSMGLSGPPPMPQLPSPMGPPVPRGLGNPNMAAPPPVIQMGGGSGPTIPMGAVPQSSQENMIANTAALIRAMRERRAMAQ